MAATVRAYRVRAQFAELSEAHPEAVEEHLFDEQHLSQANALARSLAADGGSALVVDVVNIEPDAITNA